MCIRDSFVAATIKHFPAGQVVAAEQWLSLIHI